MKRLKILAVVLASLFFACNSGLQEDKKTEEKQKIIKKAISEYKYTELKAIFDKRNF